MGGTEILRTVAGEELEDDPLSPELQELCKFCDLVSVSTACGPAVKWAKERLGPWRTRLEDDGFFLGTPPGTKPEDVTILYVAHVDEIGGVLLGPHQGGKGFDTLLAGVSKDALAGRSLVAMDYADEDGSSVRPCEAWLADDGLVVDAPGAQPFETVFTYAERAAVEGEWIRGKALDPRLAAYAVLKAARASEVRHVGVMLVFGEEGGSFAVHKAAHWAGQNMPRLQLVLNCDVPGVENVKGCGLDGCAIRLTERGTLIDPRFSLKLHRQLLERGCRITLADSASGSQTHAFAPLCQTVSFVLPAEQAHQTPTRASLRGLAELVKALTEAGRTSLVRLYQQQRRQV